MHEKVVTRPRGGEAPAGQGGAMLQLLFSILFLVIFMRLGVTLESCRSLACTCVYMCAGARRSSTEWLLWPPLSFSKHKWKQKQAAQVQFQRSAQKLLLLWRHTAKYIKCRYVCAYKVCLKFPIRKCLLLVKVDCHNTQSQGATIGRNNRFFSKSLA